MATILNSQWTRFEQLLGHKSCEHLVDFFHLVIIIQMVSIGQKAVFDT